jgi:hypothetical protein
MHPSVDGKKAVVFKVSEKMMNKQDLRHHQTSKKTKPPIQNKTFELLINKGREVTQEQQNFQVAN